MPSPREPEGPQGLGTQESLTRCVARQATAAAAPPHDAGPEVALHRLVFCDENGEQRPDVDVTLDRQSEGDVGSHAVEIASPFALALDVSGAGQVGDDALGGPLGDAEPAGDVAHAYPL